MDRWLNKSENTVKSFSSNTINDKQNVQPTNSARFKIENSPFNKFIGTK